MNTATITTTPELALVLTTIETLETSARRTASESAARGYTESASYNLRRPDGTGMLDVLVDVCIDAHRASLNDLRDTASAAYEEYKSRPGIATCDEVIAVCERLKRALG